MASTSFWKRTSGSWRVVGDHFGEIHPGKRALGGIFQQARRANGQGGGPAVDQSAQLAEDFEGHIRALEGVRDTLVWQVRKGNFGEVVALDKGVEHAGADDNHGGDIDLDIGELVWVDSREHLADGEQALGLAAYFGATIEEGAGAGRATFEGNELELGGDCWSCG